MKNTSKEKKNVKGFYTALGISALMIGSACWFSYKEGENINDVLSSLPEVSQQAVDRKKSDVPKSTTAPKRSNVYARVTTAAVTEQSATETFMETVTETVATSVETAVEEVFTESVVAEKTETPKLCQPVVNTINVINEFSGKELVKNVTTGSWQTHNGTDYRAEIGDSVFAVCDGVVKSVSDDALWGTTVVIQDADGNTYKYCNLAKDLSVQKESMVSAGDVIGAVGDTADIESGLEPHLHIEFIRNGEFVNPADFIPSEVMG